MNENEKKLIEHNASLRAQLKEAHELIAKSTYKLGVLTAFAGVPAEATHLQITAQLRGIAFLPKTELAQLRELALRSHE